MNSIYYLSLGEREDRSQKVVTTWLKMQSPMVEEHFYRTKLRKNAYRILDTILKT